jgi:hypothetical protein
MPTPPPSRFIGYPSRKVLAVIDADETADLAVAELRAAGLAADAITVLRGAADANRMDGLGSVQGWRRRLRRLTEFTVMDQLPDFVLYEHALRDGRTVLAVEARSDDDKRRVHAILRRHGGHFTNYYGRFATEELDLWRGPEPSLPGVLRR